MRKRIHGKVVWNLALYAALGCLLILLLSGASRERLLREKTSNPYSERAITVAFPDDGGETVKRLLADERLPEVELLYSDGQLLGCNGKALASERLHLLSGQRLGAATSDAPGAMIGKGLQGDVDEENRIGVLRSRLPVTGVLGYEELYTQMDYRIVVPLSYLCEEMGYARPSLIVDGTAAEMEQFRMLLAADYEKECSVQPVKEVGLREVYQIRKADNQVTLWMAGFVMLFALFEHVLMVLQSADSCAAFLTLGYGSRALNRYFVRKQVRWKLAGLAAGCLLTALLMRYSLLGTAAVCGMIGAELLLGTRMAAGKIVRNAVRG